MHNDHEADVAKRLVFFPHPVGGGYTVGQEHTVEEDIWQTLVKQTLQHHQNGAADSGIRHNPNRKYTVSTSPELGPGPVLELPGQEEGETLL